MRVDRFVQRDGFGAAPRAPAHVQLVGGVLRLGGFDGSQQFYAVGERAQGFVAVVLASGYVSLGSLLSAVLLPSILLATLGPSSPLFVVSAIVGAFVFWTHRANIGRLRRGEEHRFGKRGRA